MARFEGNVPLLPELEADLALIRSDALPEISSERLLARLNRAVLDSDRAAPAKLPERRRRLRAPHVWLFAASLSLLAVAAIMIGKSSGPAAPAAPSGVVLATPTPQVSVVLPIPDAAPASPQPADSALPRRPVKPQPSEASRSAQSELLARELMQLGQIRQALAQSPATALSLAEAGHREFKAGVMHEEREALAVLSLAQLGSRPAFEARARRFLKAYPKSGFRERIAALLGPVSAQPAP